MNKWCHEHFIKYKTISKAFKYSKKIRYRIINRLQQPDFSQIKDKLFNIEKVKEMELEERIIFCLLIGYQYQTASKNLKKTYKTQSVDKVSLDKDSFLMLNKKLPKDIFYHELFVSMGESNLNLISVIPEKIKELFT